MRKIANIPSDNPRAQCIVMLFAALHELSGNHSKRETISYIQQRHWFDIQPEDRKPYPSATANEPRWHTLIAWGRKDAVLAELMFNHPRDEWELTRRGIEEFCAIRTAYQSRDLCAEHCFLWAIAFRNWMIPNYVPSKKEWPRPKDLYRDIHKLSSRDIRKRIRNTLLDDL